MNPNFETLPKNLLNAIVTKNELVSSETIEFRMRSEDGFSFQAGQFVSLVVPFNDKWVNRAYSIASAPSSLKELSLLIKIIPDGAAGKYLPTLKLGDTIHYRKPAGKFLFESAAAQEVHFIATGTGIAPFYSMMVDQKEKGNITQRFRILCGYRHSSEILCFNELKNLSNNIQYDIAVSRDESWRGLNGRVTDHLILDKSIHYYLCGVEQMITDVKQKLLDAGIPEESIFDESYGKAFSSLFANDLT